MLLYFVMMILFSFSEDKGFHPTGQQVSRWHPVCFIHETSSCIDRIQKKQNFIDPFLPDFTSIGEMASFC